MSRFITEDQVYLGKDNLEYIGTATNTLKNIKDGKEFSVDEDIFLLDYVPLRMPQKSDNNITLDSVNDFSTILDSLEKFDNQMSLIKDMIEKEDYNSMANWMKEANKLHDIL